MGAAMAVREIITGLAVLFVSAAEADAHNGTTTPLSGAYAAGIYVASASGSGCLDSKGTGYFGMVNYLGYTQSKIVIRVPLPAEAAASIQLLTISNGAGTDAPSGTFGWKGYSTGGQLWSISGQFAATITRIDG